MLSARFKLLIQEDKLQLFSASLARNLVTSPKENLASFCVGTNFPRLPLKLFLFPCPDSFFFILIQTIYLARGSYFWHRVNLKTLPLILADALKNNIKESFNENLSPFLSALASFCMFCYNSNAKPEFCLSYWSIPDVLTLYPIKLFFFLSWYPGGSGFCFCVFVWMYIKREIHQLSSPNDNGSCEISVSILYGVLFSF